MPTKRRHRPQNWAPPISDGLRHLFQTGDPVWEGRWIAEDCFEQAQHEERWRAWGEELTQAWIDTRPGSRPWGWWRFDAPEARHVIEGAGRVIHGCDWVWREQHGVVALAAGPGPRVVVESSPSYLRRLERLDAAERAALGSAAFRPRHVPEAYFRFRPGPAGSIVYVEPREHRRR